MFLCSGDVQMLRASLSGTSGNKSVSEEISIFRAWSTGDDQAYRVRRFGCREINVPSALICFNTVYRHVVLLLLQMLS